MGPGPFAVPGAQGVQQLDVVREDRFSLLSPEGEEHVEC